MNRVAPPDESDLIAALATGVGPAAIAVLRLSGAGAIVAARTFLAGLPAALPARRLTRALAVQDGAQPLDDVLVASFPAPHSYTGETVVEVHCHGGPAMAAAIQELALKAGARLARPGEFTERAVRNGKMDLLDAEALAAVLAADGADELDSARESKKLAPRLRALAELARGALAAARAMLDHPLELGSQPIDWRAEATLLESALNVLLAGPSLESAFREGLVVALLGPPNAGKSSLFNALIGEPRALVDAEPGTTRDAQPCAVLLAGRRFTIVDTAGIREANGIEARAVARALEISRTANLLIWVEDISAEASEPPVQVDLRVLAKSDLAPHSTRLAAPGFGGMLQVSALSSHGVIELRRRVQERAPQSLGTLSARQRRYVNEAAQALGGMAGAVDDLAAEHLARAQQALASLAGTAGGLIDTSEIYARFCVGK